MNDKILELIAAFDHHGAQSRSAIERVALAGKLQAMVEGEIDALDAHWDSQALQHDELALGRLIMEESNLEKNNGGLL